MPREPQPLTDHEQRVLALIHGASSEIRAPQGLRQRIEAQRPRRRTEVRRRVGYGGALAGALAVVALALVLILPNNTPGGPSVSQAAALADLGPTGAAPAVDPHSPIKLQTNVDDLYFPNWEKIRWYAKGQRADRIGGRAATTVYYQWHGQRVAYTIVAAPALKEPNIATTVLDGTALKTFSMNGRLVVTWRRANHTCVISGTGVSASALQELAAWQAPADVG